MARVFIVWVKAKIVVSIPFGHECEVEIEALEGRASVGSSFLSFSWNAEFRDVEVLIADVSICLGVTVVGVAPSLVDEQIW